MRVEEWEKAKIFYLAGKSWQTIASELRLPIATLQTKASKEKLTAIKKGVSQIVSQSSQSLESLSILVRNRLASDAVSTLERIDSYELDGIKDESTREQILGSLSKRSALVFGWSESGESPSVSINLLGSMPDKLFQWVNSRGKIFLTISGDCEARRFEATVGDGKEGPKTPAGKTGPWLTGKKKPH